MSLPAIRAALEGALAAVSSPIAHAWENVAYVPVAGTPYEQVTLLPAEPENSEIGPGYTERGLFAVNLFYPKDKGPKDAIDRAALIRAAFAYGTELTSGGVRVNIIATPEIGPARAEDDRFMVPVRVRWHARIAS